MRNCGGKSNVNRETERKESDRAESKLYGRREREGFIGTAEGARGREARVADAPRQG